MKKFFLIISLIISVLCSCSNEKTVYVGVFTDGIHESKVELIEASSDYEAVYKAYDMRMCMEMTNYALFKANHKKSIYYDDIISGVGSGYVVVRVYEVKYSDVSDDIYENIQNGNIQVREVNTQERVLSEEDIEQIEKKYENVTEHYVEVVDKIINSK